MLRMDRERTGTLAAPDEQELLADEEEHHGDLGDRKETPNRRLFLQVRRDPGGEVRSERPQEDSLDDHVLLHDEERAKHEEGVNGGRGGEVRDVAHGHAPSKMIFALISAELFATKPFGSGLRAISGSPAHPGAEVGADGRRGEEGADEEHGAPEEAQAEDDVVLVEELGRLRQRAVDNVREIGLVTDMNETEKGQDAVHGIAALVNPEILESLEKLHEEEPEDADSEARVQSSGMNVISQPEAQSGKGEGSLLIKAHCSVKS